MTDSMIPYSFVPGTKAKADEVNANFIALANVISQNQTSFAEDIGDINTLLDNELFLQKTVTETSTNLDNYKRKGIYYFSSSYTPVNSPRTNSGFLVVLGDETSGFKQIWFPGGSEPEIYTRSFINNFWQGWYSILGYFNKFNPFCYRLPNGLIIQGGYGAGASVTYPIAYSQRAAVVVTKQGYSQSDTTTDQGTYSEDNTGFTYGACGYFSGGLNWIAIGL